MCKSLYKYMPLREEFFDNFYIRASQRCSLNDPFDSLPSMEFLADLFLCMKDTRFGNTKEEIIDNLTLRKNNPAWIEGGISLWKEVGIISLSETRDNICMWSHYAQDHKGMVVEFDTIILESFFANKLKECHNENYCKIHRVKYRNERWNEDFKSDQTEEIVRNGNIELGLDLFHPLKHKAEQWSYEKEWRLLLPLSSADQFFVKPKISSKLREITKKIALSNNILDCLHIMAMYEIPKNSIKSITFGAKCTQNGIDPIKKKISESKELFQPTLYETKIDSDNYKLNFLKIN